MMWDCYGGRSSLQAVVAKNPPTGTFRALASVAANRLAFRLLPGTVSPARPPIVAASERTGEPSRGRVGWLIFLEIFFLIFFGTRGLLGFDLGPSFVLFFQIRRGFVRVSRSYHRKGILFGRAMRLARVSSRLKTYTWCLKNRWENNLFWFTGIFWNQAVFPIRFR